MNNEARKLIEFTKKIEAVVGDFATIAGVEAVNHFTRNFAKQGFDDEAVEQWQPRKRTRGRDSGRAILVGRGNLRRSLIRKRAGKYGVFIVSPLPYANVHNEGLRSGRGKGFKMPKRQFVGDSRKLNKKILQQIDRRVNRAFEFTT